MTQNNSVDLKMNYVYSRIKKEFKKTVVGQDKIIDQVLIALFSNGHILIEGLPGLAKTLIANVLGLVVSGQFKRIQFTPDLMPSDIIGTTIFNMEQGKFFTKKGPIFTNLLLADEINRAPAKTQAALLQAMQESAVTIDGKNNSLDDFFMCMATQNPVEMEGTYPLPEAQVDRFMMKILIEYPSQDDEKQILRNYRDGFSTNDINSSGIKPIISINDISTLKSAISTITIDDRIINYITDIIKRTRDYPGIATGASPRGSVALFQASRVLAAFNGRSFVTPDDIKNLSLPILRHRLTLEAEAEIEGYTPDDYIRKIIAEVEVPR